MTRKNAQKSAARTRQAQFGGTYLSHHRLVAVGTEGPPPEDHEPTARVLDEPAYPDSEFSTQWGDEHPNVAEMCRWFFCRFEDPAQGVPHDSGEGGYQYVFGGPHSAVDEIGNAFSEMPQTHIDRALKIIHNYGWDWVPIGLY